HRHTIHSTQIISRAAIMESAALLIPLCLLFIPLCTSTLCPLIYDVALNPHPTFSTVYFKGMDQTLLLLGIADVFRSIAPIGLLLVMSGLILWWREHRQHAEVLLCVAWLLLFFYFTNTAGYTARFFTELMPIAIIAIAYALARATRENQWSWVMALSLLSIIWVASVLPLLVVRHAESGPKQFSLLVGNHTSQNAEIIAMDEAVFLQYYANRSSLSYPISSRTEDYQAWVDRIAELLHNGTPVYAISTPWNNKIALVDYDQYHYDGQIHAMLERNFNLTTIAQGTSENYHHAELMPSGREEILEEVHETGRS
ncbi:MAG TPA: hypothetical protein VJK52_04075, partial [Candidatus Nanoarchaeia archaeon]|nr:hypothetical protein [Candidatus Nanoarchaeia archaeon]